MDTSAKRTLLAQLAAREVPDPIDLWPEISRSIPLNRQGIRFVRPWLVTGGAAVAIALLALTMVSVPLGSDVESVRAETLMDRAQAATSAMTYHMVLSHQPVAKTPETITAEVWFAGADRQRSTQQTHAPNGAVSETSDWVFNGADAWLATTKNGHTSVIHTVGTEWTRP
ncbi:MAG: hypothetical protein JO106_08585, partial [Mycobacterium sp.]|nr:hypothetical protein [Mycobacterium sp.]